MASAFTEARRAELARRIRLLVAATISYNVIEAAVALTEGARVSSAALIGFWIELGDRGGVGRRDRLAVLGTRPSNAGTRRIAFRAYSFFALAIYVTVDSVLALCGVREARHSPVGIGLAAVSLVVMPVLSWAQRRAGRELGSSSAVADSKQTLLCTYLSAVLLVGLLLNALFGWSWADPIAALVIAGVAAREGRQAWRGDPCCGPTSTDACC